MENYIVSARKYRPQTFRTVVGQQHITNTLKNAIISNHLAQAFLFCGPRGVGKTTCARILAKTINCFNITAEGEACDTCESCTSFNANASLNIHELDAASNNSVDEIRVIVEQVRFAPQLGTHKVYIIDEVHMLSNSAFNAFLKTLEEPPKHAVFILATTEKHKVLPTILSRCQVFVFNRIKNEDISNHLAHIASTEGVSAEPEALRVIAQKADGGLRDACSIFDQMVSFSGSNITYKVVAENLHILDYDYYFKITDALNQNRLSDVLLIFDEILKNGFDGHHFIVGLGEHIRNVLVCKDPATVQLLETSQNIKDTYLQQAQQCPNGFLLKALGIIGRLDVNYRIAKNQRLAVELALMQISYLNNAASLDAEKKKVELAPASDLPISNQVVSSSAPAYIPNTTTNKPVTSFKDLDIKSGFRLNQINRNSSVPSNEKEAKSEVDAVGVNLNEPFTSADLFSAIKKYISLKNETKEFQVVAMLAEQFLKYENQQLKILLTNDAQHHLFDEIKQDFLDFIRKEVKNNSITIEISELEDNKQKKALTPSEKFNVMALKNPLLKELRSRLDLDPTFN